MGRIRGLIIVRRPIRYQFFDLALYQLTLEQLLLLADLIVQQDQVTCLHGYGVVETAYNLLLSLYLFSFQFDF